jgi:uncharacterized RDD family membrane protein YckC
MRRPLRQPESDSAMPARANIYLIKTPEGIVFSQLLAGPVSRFGAWLLDAAVISATMTILGIILLLFQLISRDLAGAVSALVYFVVSIGYGTFFEWYWRGQTLGKKVFRLRVVDAQGLRLQFNQIVIRNLLRFVDSLPMLYFLGGVTCLLSQKCQRLGDLAANTVVIHFPRITEPDLDQLLAGKFNSLRQYPHLEARFRQRVTPPEAALALQALLRRDEFEPQARIELFREIAAHFRAKAEFPPEATEGITDEQYVRNITDVVYRSAGRQREQPTTPAATI